MKKSMTSRERILAAMSRQEVDYVPCCFEFEFSPLAPGYTYNDQFERVRIMQKLGVEPYYQVEPAKHYKNSIKVHSDVRTKVWEEQPAGERYPLLHKEYSTPAGKLECIVKKTEDWPYGQDIPIFSDFNTPRYVKPLVADKSDVEKLPYLFDMPDGRDRDEWAKIVNDIKSKLDTKQVILKGYVGSGMDPLMWMCGAETAVVMAMEEPELVHRILEITHKYEMEFQKMLVELGIDYIERRGWYETTDFWSPKIYQDFAVDNMSEEIEAIHRGGAKVVYTMCTGIMALLPLIKQLDFDCFFGAEPVLGDQDMKVIARELGDRRAMWTGLSAPIHIGRGTVDEVRLAVKNAFDVFGKKGFILAPVPSIRPEWPWGNVLAMIDEWKKLR